jgi:hypothetical protein
MSMTCTPHGYFSSQNITTEEGRTAVVIAGVYLRATPNSGGEAWRWRCSTWLRGRDGAHRVRLRPLATGTKPTLAEAQAAALEAKREQANG